MKSYRIISLLLLILFSYVIFSSCKKKDDPEPAQYSIVQVLRHSNEFDSLIVALDRSLLLLKYEYAPDYYNGYPLTAPNKNLRLLAPPNKAFVRLLDSLHLKSMNEIPLKDLRRLMDYLGFVEEHNATQKENYYLRGMYSDYVLRFTNNGKRVWSSSKDFSDIYMEYTCINGKILVVDKVLIPPIPSVPPIKSARELVDANPDLDSLEVAMNVCGKMDFGKGTVLAPNNKAFVDFLSLIHKDKISDVHPYVLLAILQRNVMLNIVVQDQLINNTSMNFGDGEAHIIMVPPYLIPYFINVKNDDSGIYLTVNNRVENKDCKVVSTEDMWFDPYIGEELFTHYYGVMHITDKVLLPTDLNLNTLEFY